MANCYFLFIVILEALINGFVESMISLFPLALVVTVSMIKDAIEDNKRYKSDQTENDRATNFAALGSR
jgi:hypothetical protein